MVVVDFPVLLGIRKVPLARRGLGHIFHVRDHLEAFLKVVVEDDEHRQSEVGGRSKQILYHLIVVVELVQDDGDSFHGNRLFDCQEDQ